MSVIENYPALRPSLLLDFANSGRVDPRVTFARAAAASRWNAAGLQELVAAGVPRIDHDPATGRCLGLYVEEARTNLVRRSNELSHADWVQSALVGIGAPDANLMTKLVATTENRTHELYSATSSIGFADETLLTISVEAKADGANFFWLRCVNKAGSFPSATFNLLTGAASLRGAVSANMKSLGGGVYRCSATFNLGAGASGSAGRTVLALASGEGAGAEVFAGDGVSGVWFRNVQTEVGATPSSYIPTTSAAATRAAESPHIDVSADWYNPAGGTLFVEAIAPNSAQAFARIASFERPGVNVLSIQRVQDATQSTARGYFEGASIVAGNTSFPPSVPVKVALAGAPGDFALSASGSIFTSGLGAFSTPTQLRLGSSIFNSSHLNGHIQRVAYYPRRLTNAQLQRLTA